MGKKAKSSRKGKKAWRANISTEDIEEYFEKSTKDALSGGSVADAPGDSLFFVEKSGDLSVKRKIEKHGEKVLHSESLLQRNPFIQPIQPPKQKKFKNKSKPIQIPRDAAMQEDNGVQESGLVNIWDDEGDVNVKAKRPKTSIIPAVEVDAPGCSFNPPSESHQDSLASAVAHEMLKVYRHELGPGPFPLTVAGEVVDEEQTYFLDVDNESDEDGTNEDSENMDLEKREDLHQAGDIKSSREWTDPHPKHKKRRCKEQPNVFEHPSLEEFVKQQKSYFEEVDAFELPVEEVSCNYNDMD